MGCLTQSWDVEFSRGMPSVSSKKLVKAATAQHDTDSCGISVIRQHTCCRVFSSTKHTGQGGHGIWQQSHCPRTNPLGLFLHPWYSRKFFFLPFPMQLPQCFRTILNQEAAASWYQAATVAVVFVIYIYTHTYILVNTVKYQYTYTKHIIYISIVW
jgi:hypothetical protein